MLGLLGLLAFSAFSPWPSQPSQPFSAWPSQLLSLFGLGGLGLLSLFGLFGLGLLSLLSLFGLGLLGLSAFSPWPSRPSLPSLRSRSIGLAAGFSAQPRERRPWRRARRRSSSLAAGAALVWPQQPCLGLGHAAMGRTADTTKTRTCVSLDPSLTVSVSGREYTVSRKTARANTLQRGVTFCDHSRVRRLPMRK